MATDLRLRHHRLRLRDHDDPARLIEQCDQAFRNIEAALKQANGRIEDIVRANFILPDRADWPPCWPVVKKWLGRVRPASTMIVAGLQAPEMRIEIEVTARLRRREGDK